MLKVLYPRLLFSSSLVALALGVVGAAVVWAWPEPWDEAPVVAAAPSAPVTFSFSAPVAASATLVQPLTLTPVLEDGVPRGLALGEVHEGSLFARMGLQEGDVLLGFHDLGSEGAPLLVAHIEREGRALRVEYAAVPPPSAEPPSHTASSVRAAPPSSLSSPLRPALVTVEGP